MSVRSFLRLFAGLSFCIALATAAPAQPAKTDTATGTEPLTLMTSSGPHKFAVEVMRTRAQLAKGLMYRRYLPADRGMLFEFDHVAPVMMWMRNTYIPLDMIFIDKGGKVISIAANTEPLSDHIISSGGAVLAALEVNAGTAVRIGLKVGDKVVYPLFAK